MIYLIGSLRNPNIPVIGNQLRDAGFEVFDNWWAAGKEADDYWQRYSKIRGMTYKEALESPNAKHVFAFDYNHLHLAEMVVLVLPAGKSAHLELGWSLGQGKKGYVLFTEPPDRYDVMYQFATGVCESVEELLKELKYV